MPKLPAKKQRELQLLRETFSGVNASTPEKFVKKLLQNAEKTRPLREKLMSLRPAQKPNFSYFTTNGLLVLEKRRAASVVKKRLIARQKIAKERGVEWKEYYLYLSPQNFEILMKKGEAERKVVGKVSATVAAEKLRIDPTLIDTLLRKGLLTHTTLPHRKGRYFEIPTLLAELKKREIHEAILDQPIAKKPEVKKRLIEMLKSPPFV